MDPYNHNHHHTTHHHRDEPPYPPHVGGGHYPPPPQPHVGGGHYPPPPPPHVGGGHYPPPPPPHIGGGHYPPPPHLDGPHYPSPTDHHHHATDHHHHEPHVEHYPPPPAYRADDYHHPPPAQASHHTPEMINHHTPDHHKRPAPKYTDNKPTVRVYCKAKTNYALTIRDGKVILAPANSSDLHQHWIKDLKFSTRVKDEQGYPSFALVNKATGQAIKHSIGPTYPVQLTEYNPDKLDESVLWTESKDLGDGYRAVRMVNNIRLNLDAFNGDKNHGGVRDGTKIVLWEWKKDGNQRWTMVPY